MPKKDFSLLDKKLQNEAVKEYYDILLKKKGTLFIKRVLDVLICSIAFIVTLPFFIIFFIGVKLTSKGPAILKQERIGKDMKPFNILKFRTMVVDADKKGGLLTTKNDKRITKFGRFLRATNMDEMPQLINVIKGDMSIVGTRPEVKRYVDYYTDEMYATLLLRPGMLSNASIKYKDESKLLSQAEDVTKTYVEKILPDKMKYNLLYLKDVNILTDIKIILGSIACMFK